MNFLFWPTILHEWMPCLFVVCNLMCILFFLAGKCTGFHFDPFIFRKTTLGTSVRT